MEHSEWLIPVIKRRQPPKSENGLWQIASNKRHNRTPDQHEEGQHNVLPDNELFLIASPGQAGTGLAVLPALAHRRWNWPSEARAGLPGLGSTGPPVIGGTGVS